MKLKCGACKLQRRIEATDDGSERLLHSYSGYDEKKRRLYTVYCRKCRHLSFYRFAFFGGKKIRDSIDGRAFYSAILDKRLSKEAFNEIGANIQQAMIEDRVLPPRWELI